MKICPNCGFVDPQCWRQNRWISNVDYTRVEDFQTEYPQFSDLQPGEERSDDQCYYYRGKRNPYFVYRWPKFLGPRYYTSTHHLTERHVPQVPPLKGQKTLPILVAAPDPLRGMTPRTEVAV